jgi:hypothetical protein
MCGCVEPTHELAGCPMRAVLELRAWLFDRLYGAAAFRLLNPGYRGDDPTCRRFALLEID